MRDAGKKREIRRTRDLIRAKLAFRREKPYKYKAIPNEIKDKNATIILEKTAARIIENPPNTSLNTRKTLKEHFKNK
jgi:hypothetical protein